MKINLLRICKIAGFDNPFQYRWVDNPDITKALETYESPDVIHGDVPAYAEIKAEFRTDAKDRRENYIVNFDCIFDDDPRTMVSFEFLDMQLLSTGEVGDMTIRGDISQPLRVFSTVKKIVEDFCEVNRNNLAGNKIVFSANAEEGRTLPSGETRPTRAILYEKMLRFFRAKGWETEVVKERDYWAFEAESPRYEQLLEEFEEGEIQ